MELENMKLSELIKLTQRLGSKQEKKEADHGIRIVILQRGWVMIGRYFQKGMNCRLENAAVIRKWGTTKGLPQLAIEGKLSDTVLDKSPNIHFHKLTEIAAIQCDESKWKCLC